MSGKKGFVLDAFGENDAARARARDIFLEEAKDAGWTMDVARIGENPIAACNGCYGCWIKTHGICRIDDWGRELTARMVQSDLTVWLTPIVFGGFSSQLKTTLERTALPRLSPFFTVVNDRTRHHLRYAHNPNGLAIGWLPRVDPEQERLFSSLVERNGANIPTTRSDSLVLHGNQSEEAIRQAVRNTLTFSMPPNTTTPRTILLLNGSPRPSGSTTTSLETYLAERLKTLGGVVETMKIGKSSHKTAEDTTLKDAVQRADRVVLGFPLYADWLPGTIIETLEHIATWRSQTPATKKQGLYALINCGFPEAVNNDAALEVCRLFARDACFDWLGGVYLGGGGMIDGQPLDKFGPLSSRLRKALDAAAETLLAQKAPQLETKSIRVESMLPRWLYLIIANAGWNKTAKANGAYGALKARPYDTQPQYRE